MGTSEGRTEYQIEIAPIAKQDLAHLSREVTERISQKINWIAQNVHSIAHKALHHMPDDQVGMLKYRVGDYRILYQIIHSQKLIKIFGVMNRKEEYRRLRR